MILQELVRYYDRKARDPDPAQRLPSAGLEDKEIPFIIELAPGGQVLQLIDTRELAGKKLRARSFLVPLGEKKTSGIKANLLWDSAAYVVGLDTGRKSAAEITPAAAFRARIDALPEAARQDAGVRAVLAALDRADWSVLQAHPAWPDIAEANLVMTFRLAGDLDLVCQRPAVVAAATTPAAAGDERQLHCLIDGEPAPVQRLHASIKGVWGAQSSGANIVSFNARAFESYGKTERQGENAPISQRAAFAYTTALNHLLDKDSRNRVQVGDASTVFWADGASAFDGEFTLADFFGETKDDQTGVYAPCMPCIKPWPPARCRWVNKACGFLCWAWRPMPPASASVSGCKRRWPIWRRASCGTLMTCAWCAGLTATRRCRRCSACCPAWRCRASWTTCRHAWPVNGCAPFWKATPTRPRC